MNIKRFLAILCVSAILMSFSACNSNKTSETNVTPEDNSSSTDISVTAAETHEEATDEKEEYSNKIYYVGDDIPADSYIINCTHSEYGMDVVIFPSESEYTDFQNTEKFTNGEFRNAVETHAWADFYLYEGEQAFITLKSGNIILLDDGMCEFTKYSTSNDDTLYSGIYIVGEDIQSNKYDIKCTSNYMQITIFENKEKYLEFHKSDRFTRGEQADAIQKHSLITEFIYNDSIVSADLTEGMIVMIEDGIGKYTIDEGPAIN